jgi:hypothetical protein
LKIKILHKLFENDQRTDMVKGCFYLKDMSNIMRLYKILVSEIRKPAGAGYFMVADGLST